MDIRAVGNFSNLQREPEETNQVSMNGRDVKEIRQGDSFDKTLSTVAKIALVVFLAQLVAPLILPMAIGTMVLLCSPLPIAIGAIALICSKGGFGSGSETRFASSSGSSQSFRTASYTPPHRKTNLYARPGGGVTHGGAANINQRQNRASTTITTFHARPGGGATHSTANTLNGMM